MSRKRARASFKVREEERRRKSPTKKMKNPKQKISGAERYALTKSAHIKAHAHTHIYIHTHIQRERDNNVLDETDPPESGNRVRNRALSRESVETFLRFQLEKSEEFRFTERRVRETGVGGEV